MPRLGAGWRVKEVNLLRDEAERSIWRERLVAQLAMPFAFVAVVLAAIGLYGTVSYYVSRNQRAIGIRMAIGAAPWDVVALLAGRLTRLLGLGILLGVLGAFGLREWVRALLFGVAPVDPVAIASGVGVVALVAAGAVALPAWRAIRIDPAASLRAE